MKTPSFTLDSLHIFLPKSKASYKPRLTKRRPMRRQLHRWLPRYRTQPPPTEVSASGTHSTSNAPSPSISSGTVHGWSGITAASIAKRLYGSLLVVNGSYKGVGMRLWQLDLVMTVWVSQNIQLKGSASKTWADVFT